MHRTLDATDDVRASWTVVSLRSGRKTDVREPRERDDGGHEPSSRDRSARGTEIMMNASLQSQLVHAHVENLHRAARRVNRDRAVASTASHSDRRDAPRLSALVRRVAVVSSESAARHASTPRRSTARRSRP